MKKYSRAILMTVAVVGAITLSLEITRTLHKFYHRSIDPIVFSPPEPGAGAASAEAPALNKDFSSPSSEPGAVDSWPAAPVHIFDYDGWLDAIEMQESSGYPNAKGDWVRKVRLVNGDWVLDDADGVYRAVGTFQLWKIYVDEVNRICGVLGLTERFTYDQRWDRGRSRTMSLIHNEYWADIAMLGTDMDYAEAFVRSHQGACGYRTESTKAYWLKVKARMEKVKVMR